MKFGYKLTIALLAVALTMKANAQQTGVVIDLTEQAAYLFEGGRVVLISPIASGKEGRGTPTGTFRIISKDSNHQSGSFGLVLDSYGRIVDANATPASHVPPGCHYEPAPMPYFMEFSKYVGMHAGYLPGYPASHGCVRMPKDLAAEFFARVQVGTPVRVTGSARNASRVRKAIPLVQPGESRYAAAGRPARNVNPILRFGRFHIATIFSNSRPGNQ
ncbi:MAG TPA: L,D-transpeptidase [Chthoniobacterales bacterium]|nr:L,D-transpeptidase [Chthoniobacterales bacterium]